MLLAYFFKSDKRCFSRRTIEFEDDQYLSEIARLEGAAYYCTSLLDIPLVDARYDDGQVLNDPLPPPPLTYAESRYQAYPSLRDQLDMLWHAMDDGTLPAAEPFYSTIKAVKDAHPKPVE